MGIRKIQSDHAGPPRRHRERLRRAHPRRQAGQGPAAAEAAEGRRNNQGRITARHRGGGHKRNLRQIDFRRDKDGIPAVVNSIQYDPNRSPGSRFCTTSDGEKRYILAPEGLKAGDHVQSGADARPPWATACRCRPFRWAWTFTTSRCSPAAAACCAVRRASAPPWLPATPIGPKSTSPAVKSAASRPAAGPPSVLWATPITWAS